MDRTEPIPQPAKSAKDAINAMYAAGANKTGLSDYLATSAKEIINATPSTKKRDTKSAASLHSHDSGRRRESVRPSASALLRQAAPKPAKAPKPITGSVDPLASRTEVAVTRSATKRAKPSTSSSSAPVVRTSLSLGPKKPPMISKAPAVSRNSARRPAGDTLRAKKQPIAVKPAPRPAHTENPRVFQDIVRPGAQSQQAPQPKARPAASTASNSAKARLAPAAPKTHRPLDSIKNRFRPAPKGYATSDPRRGRPYKAEDFLNPSHSMPEDVPSSEQPDRATHIYGMIEAPREYSDLPRWAKTTNDLEAASAAAQASPDSGLGVIEDYGDPIAHKFDQLEQPDNNRYALSSQSPFFLQTVEVDKRPLSGGPSIREQVETPLSVNQNLTDHPKHNRYEKKPKTSKKPKSISKSTSKSTVKSASQPSTRDDLTVIIPSARHSHIPLFLLLIITILLGAIIGALAYLFLFQ